MHTDEKTTSALRSDTQAATIDATAGEVGNFSLILAENSFRNYNGRLYR
jgi:hypothetical protein